MSGPELKPCPFCGGALDYAEPVTYVHPIGKCILSGRNFKAGYIGQWNTRTPDPAQIRADALREAFQFPENVIDLVKRIGRAEWGTTEPKTAEDHGADMVNTVKKTAAHFGQIDQQAMHGLYIDGTNIVICHAGVSPNSPEIARVLTGMWNMLCDATTLSLPAVDNSPAPDAGGKEGV